MNPKVFISYSHDSQDYKDWVRSFADRLIVDGIDVTLDQYDLALGEMIPHFMEKGISENNFVLILVSKGFTEKARERKGGVGFETDLAAGEIVVKQNRRKFIPILIKISYDDVPYYLRGANAVSIQNLFAYNKEYEEIYRTLTGQKPQKPKLGTVKLLHPIGAMNEAFDTELLMRQTNQRQYFFWDFLLESESLDDMTLSELYPLYRKNIFTKIALGVEQDYPFVFRSSCKKANHPELVYESDNYSKGYTNLANFDKLILYDRFVRYSYIDLASDQPFLLGTRIPIGSVIAFLTILGLIHKELGRQPKINVTVKLKASETAIFFEKYSFFPIEAGFMDNYIFQEGEKTIDHTFTSLSIDDLHTFIIKTLSPFISDKPQSDNPFLSVSIAELRKAYDKLLNVKDFF